MTVNQQRMRDAKASLRGKWGGAALAYFLMTICLCAASFTGIGILLLAGPLAVGFIKYLGQIRSGNSPKLETLFSGFDDFLRNFLSYLLYAIFIFLWMLLFIIPGIIMSFAYAMTPFILADDEYRDLSAMDVIRRSRDMMRGNKWRLFCLQLRFIGWGLLAGLTFGILLFWIVPYIQMSVLNFYNDIKAEWKARNGVKEVEIVEIIVEK